MRTNSRFKAISRAVFGLLTTALSLSASVTHTVGAHGEYPTLEAAITALTPFTDDVVLQVDVGFNDGYGDPGMLIDESTFGNNGYSLTVEGVVLFDFDATYYVGDIEFRVGKDNSLETIENTDAGAFSARTVYQGDAAGESEEYLIKNHLGSTAVVTNEFGLYVGPTYDYQGYGMQDKVVGTPTARVTKTFTGKELDDELGLYYFGARYYDPDLAMWISPDPARQYNSPYTYCGSNPVVCIDDNGKFGAAAAIINGKYTPIQPEPVPIPEPVYTTLSALSEASMAYAAGSGDAYPGPIDNAAALFGGLIGKFALLITKPINQEAFDALFLYQKVSATGEHLKFGVTINPETRYTTSQLAGGRLRILANGERKGILKLERDLHETLPIGPEEGQKFYINKQVEKGLKPPPYEK